ncbi:erythromycin esterase family protein [uncultured Hymenobacter sp.]|uniref:erythromycin esterase family protein n=1 Tax=uncultured Hymenobacter sp. TaxID=170016 RepID=UPI0035CC7298
MLPGFRLCWFLLMCALPTARAQTPAPPTPAPLPVHALRSISPADTAFQDLEFLGPEIGLARVVMLGEPTHGEGNVTEAKIRLVRFLRERLGFTTLAFESGFYDLHRAQQALEAGESAVAALGNSVFTIWTATQEFQAVLPLVGPGQLRVAGFDPQLSGDYGGDVVDELQTFLAPEKGATALSYDFLDEVISLMADQFMFPPTGSLAYFEREIAKATRLLDKAAAGPDARRRAEATFWRQCLRSLLAQARDYATHDPTAKDSADFKATDSNPRDAQMADNLLWYLRAHPQEKVICWGALPHLANKTEALGDAELQAYRPMGRAVKATLGADQVYVLGTLAGGGSHSFLGHDAQPVPVPAAGTLEAELLAQPVDYAFVSLKHDAPGRVLTTSAFEYRPLTGPWSEVVDGFLFLRTVNPPHLAGPLAGAVPAGAATPTPEAAGSAFNPAPRRASGRVQANGGPAGRRVQGVVLDQKTKAPVPYASVSAPEQGVGTVADGQGRFTLKITGAEKLQVSSVGYAPARVAAPAPGAPLTVRLVPAAYELQSVQVRGESLDPRRIMKKVVAAIGQNYEQQDYMAEVYTHRQTSNFDTVRAEVEYVSTLLTPAGQRDLHGGFLMRQPMGQHRVREARVLREAKATQGLALVSLEGHGQGFYTGGADPVRTSPLFKARWRKFNLQLDTVLEQGGETVYVISFAARRASHRSTGTYLQAGYSGRFRVQQRDYAVTHYEALWRGDTLTQNAVARKHVGRGNLISQLYSNVYTAEHNDHVVNYARAPNGRYQVRRSVGQGLDAGRVLKTGRAFYVQRSCEQIFTPLPAGTALPPPNPKADPRWSGMETHQLQFTDYRPAFWQTYRRPTAEE